MRKSILLSTLVLSMIIFCIGCAPSTFIKGRSGGWKTIELNDSLTGNYEEAWQKTVDTIARDYDIEMLDKDSGYLRTTWTYGISGGTFNRYRGRLTIKYPKIENPDKMEVKTDAQWLVDPSTGVWQQGFDSLLDRDVFTALSGRLGRTVAPE
jgi:hypothetical protein